MPPRLTKAQRAELAPQAVEMSATGMSYRAIGRELDLHWKTVNKLIDDDLAARAEHRENDRERSIARDEAVIRAAWEAFQDTEGKSLNKSAYLNVIVRANERIDKKTGAEKPQRLEFEDVTEYQIEWPDAVSDRDEVS